MGDNGISRGTYGVRVTGLGDPLTMGVVPTDWPRWHVTADADSSVLGERHPEFVTAEAAHIRFQDGSTADVVRDEPGAAVDLRLAAPVPRLQDLVHPYLGVVGMVSAYWGDRIPFHAGAVGIDGRAWLVSASKSGGKSTTLAMLAMSGHPVLADDLSVVDDSLNVHRGPRFVDLRREAAEALGIGEYVGVLGVRQRWRYAIGEAPLTLPLGGLVIPAWGPPGIEPIRGSARLGVLAPNVSLRVPGPWNELFMDVALSIPMLRWSRHQSITDAAEAISRLVEVVSSI